MKNDRLRIPVEEAYVSALGLALYAFARLEWDAVWCCEAIRKNSIMPRVARMTSGQIAAELAAIVASEPPAADLDELKDATAEFQALVNTRNALVHAKPGTTATGEQALGRDGQFFTVEMINAAADTFTACSIRLGALMHSRLSAQGR